MSGRYFLDTNVIVYSFDPRSPAKAGRARKLIARAVEEGAGIVGTQVIGEFLNVALTKFEKPLSVDDCRRYLKTVLFPLCEGFPDPPLFELALDARRASGFSLYDCLILAAAETGGCDTLYSEDMQDGYRFRGVRIIDPFA
jgi:predicted nucleic acid-binding protein